MYDYGHGESDSIERIFFFSSRRRHTSYTGDWSSDVCSSDLGDVEGAFKEADTVVDERVTIHRYCSTPLETFGVMAQYEAATQSYTIWGHTQQPAQDLHVLAAALGISPGKIRMIVPPMGGSFGNKVRPLFIIAAALLARKAGRPVKWIEDRKSV